MIPDYAIQKTYRSPMNLAILGFLAHQEGPATVNDICAALLPLDKELKLKDHHGVYRNTPVEQRDYNNPRLQKDFRASINNRLAATGALAELVDRENPSMGHNTRQTALFTLNDKGKEWIKYVRESGHHHQVLYEFQEPQQSATLKDILDAVYRRIPELTMVVTTTSLGATVSQNPVTREGEVAVFDTSSLSSSENHR